jgi:hypothetical protein
MEREGLGRGIEDISHLFLTPRPRRAGPEPRGAPPTAIEPLESRPDGCTTSAAVWAVVRAGQTVRAPAESWRLAWRLAPLGTHTLHVAVGPVETVVRWLGQAPAPPQGAGLLDLLELCDAAVIDLTEAAEAVRRAVLAAAGELLVLTGTGEADALAAYALVKTVHEALPDVALALEVLGPAEQAAAVRARLEDAARHFLATPLADWRKRDGGESAGPCGPEPPRCASGPTEQALSALCALAARGKTHEPRKPDAEPGMVQPPSPLMGEGQGGGGTKADLSPRAHPSPARGEGTVEPQPPLSLPPPPPPDDGALRPLLLWPDPDPAQLADFIQRHPHLVQADLTVVDRGLHAAGDGTIDLLGADQAGRATVVLVSTAGDALLLSEGLGYLRWCLREARVIQKLHAHVQIDAAMPPRLVLAACRFDQDVLEAARSMTRPAVALVELRAYELAGQRAVAVARVA